jgi:ankyrin repeat protein
MNNVEMVKLLCEHPNIDMNPQDNLGRTPLFYCTSVEMLEVLMDNLDTDPNIKDHMGDTIFHTNHDYEFYEMLIKYPRVDFNMANKNGFTLIQLCVHNSGLIALLLANAKIYLNYPFKDGEHILFKLKDNYEDMYIYKMVVSNQRVNINYQNNSGRSPLFYTSIEQTKVLLADDRINVNLQDNEGDTVLHIVLTQEKLTLLLNHPKINPNIKNKYGIYPWSNITHKNKLIPELIANHPKTDQRKKMQLKSIIG